MKHVSLLAAAFLASAAYGNEAPLFTGKAAYGDWTKDSPGVRRLISPADLMPMNATVSVSNGPRVVRAPADAALKVPTGFKVSAFLTGLKEPRQMKLAPNGDIFLAECGARGIRIIHSSANADKAGSVTVFANNLPERPYGIAFYPPGDDPHYVYVATVGHVLRYPYHSGDVQARGPAETIISDLPLGGHSTRDVAFTSDGSKMLVTVGSGSNDGENGMAEEVWRANVLEYNPDGTGKRVYASGLRNPVTLALNPATHAFWTVVNERDMLGDDLPPDYATQVDDGGFYGWPYYYIGSHSDSRHMGERPELSGKVRVPDVLLQPHSAPLGLAFYTASQFPAEYRGDLFVGLHGSWNRSKRTGYKLVRVRFKDGRATGEYDDFLTGFVTKDANVWGRPVGVVVAQDGALIMSDDVSGTLWRIVYEP